MYQKYLNKEMDDYSEEDDPFWEPLEDLFIGIAPAFLRALAYHLDIDEELKIMDFFGDELGTINVKLVPCSSSKIKSGISSAAVDSDEVRFIEDPRELIGKRYHFKIMLHSLNLYNSDPAKQNFTVYYRVFKESELTAASVGMNKTHTRICSIDQITHEHLDYFNTDFICFMVYCSQVKKESKTSFGVSSLFFPLANLNFASNTNSASTRRYSRLSVEELNDISKLKTDLTILQRGLDSFMQKDKRLAVSFSAKG
ncbi:unnamed protein product [Trichobilharzia regenti]|nr:unnamed protein product [Trichobilharzia regenti]